MVSSANLAVLECTWSGETCGLATGTIISQPDEVITISGKPTNYINTVTTIIGFDERFITKYIPANIFTIFTNLKWLQMSNCGITNLAANFSKSCPFLETLTIDEGALKDVPEGFLQTCSNLITISIRHHQITTVDKNAFRGLSKLQNIEMTRNKIKCLHPDLFQHTPMLLRVFFPYNKITAIDRNLLRNLKSIAFFDVKYNSLTYLPVLNLTTPGSFSMAFYAYGNPINAIDPNFCSIFANRIYYFWVNFYIKNIPCLPQDSLVFKIDKPSCPTSASILQNCYANWVPNFSNDVICSQNSGVCIPPNVWTKFTDFVKYLPL